MVWDLIASVAVAVMMLVIGATPLRRARLGASRVTVGGPAALNKRITHRPLGEIFLLYVVIFVI
jgi:hypothetical protein